MKVWKTIVLLLLLGHAGRAQKIFQPFISHPDSAIKGYDTSYVDPLLNTFTLRVYTNYKDVRLDLFNRNHRDLSLNAGEFLRYGLGIGYRYVIINYAYGIDPFRASSDRQMRHFNLQMNVFGHRFLYDIRYQFHRGFQSSLGYLPDLVVEAAGGSLRYNFNHRKYSFKNTFDQTQWQKKSQGSPIAGLDFAYTRISGDSALKVAAVNNELHSFHESYHLRAGVGYTYTVVMKEHWYITACLTLYAEGRFSGSSSNFDDNAPFDLELIPEHRIGFGYNSAKHCIGFQGMWFYSSARYSEVNQYRYNYQNLKLIYAYRFNFDVHH